MYIHVYMHTNGEADVPVGLYGGCAPRQNTINKSPVLRCVYVYIYIYIRPLPIDSSFGPPEMVNFGIIILYRYIIYILYGIESQLHGEMTYPMRTDCLRQSMRAHTPHHRNNVVIIITTIIIIILTIL